MPRIPMTVIIIVTMLICPTLLAAAGGSGPGMEGRLKAFAEAFNSGDPDVMVEHYRQAMTDSAWARRKEDQRRSRYQKLYDDLGAIQIVGIELKGPGEATLVAASEHHGRVRFVFTFAEQPPHRIESLSIRVGGPDSDHDLPPVPKLGAGDLETWQAEIDTYLEALAKQGLFSGTVLLARSDSTLYEGAFGLASREYGVPITLTTRFDLGSITKILTKTAIGQLARDGRLELDDTIYDHLPDYPNPEVACKITIEHLLGHTSGLGDIFVERFMEGSKTRFRTPQDFFAIFASEPLLFAPGEGQQYSNAGYIVLGAIVAAASDQPYAQYLAEQVMEPAGMAASGFFAKDVPTPEVAVGYTKMGFGEAPGEWRINTFMTPIQGCPAGGLMATAGDLWRFDRALRSGRLLGPGWTDWVFTDIVPAADAVAGEQKQAEYGWGIAGGAPGVNALLDSDGGLAVVVLANLDPPIAMALGQELRKAVGD